MLANDNPRQEDGSTVSLLDQERQAGQALSLIEGLLRQLRLQQEPAEEQQTILAAAFPVVPVQCLVWIPLDPRGALLHQGENGLSSIEYRQLADFLEVDPEVQPGTPYVCNAAQAASWGPRFPGIATLLAFQAADQGPLGWFLAVNKQTPPAADAPVPGMPPFRTEDVALLAPFAALLEMQLRSFHRYHDLKTLLVGLTRSLTSALDAKDAYTYGHSERVARIAVELGRELGLCNDELSDLYLVGLLHDVGNLGIREAVLSKTEPLTTEEFEHIKQHVTLGYSILSDLHPIRHLLPGVLYHHENYDGSGYPDGLAGEAIPLIARILAVAESCDAMSSKRPYRNALPHRRVEEIFVEGAGKQWDQSVVGAFLRCRHKIHTIRQRGLGPSLHVAIDRALRGEPPARPRLCDTSSGASPNEMGRGSREND
jgi:HD-GYP domain-containing protein (c-di-GMP phosphodiesterase class II)